MNKEILDKYGKLITKNVYDDAISYLIQLIDGKTKWGTGKEYTQVFHRLNKSDQDILIEYLKSTIGTTIFGMLGIFEDNPEFKIIHESEGKQTDLVKISEMLKAEATIEGGWIDRFSKFNSKLPSKRGPRSA